MRNQIKSSLPYTGTTPIEERKQFVRHLHSEGFTPWEIQKIYKNMSYSQIKKTINGKSN